VSSSPHQPVQRVRRPRFVGRAIFVTLLFSFAAVLVLPATVFGQGTPTAVPAAGSGATLVPVATLVPIMAATAVPAAQATAVPVPALAMSTPSGLVGATVTANGVGFKPTELVDISFNGASVGTPTVNSGGTFSLSFAVPDLAPGPYGVLAKGGYNGTTASTSFSINQGAAALAFSVPTAAPGTALTVTGTAFQPGEIVQLAFNGPAVGTGTADTTGAFAVTFSVPVVAAGSYAATATGETSGITTTASYSVLASTAAAATAAPTAAAVPAPAAATAAPTPATAAAAAANAPAMAHDDHYFPPTSYRIDDDQVWAFFQGNGGLATFGYPISRTMSFLGCPVQMFQRQIIQVCAGQGAGIINMLDPEIFPYTQVNGSTFPGPDATMKSSTPPVSSATYSTDISAFVDANVSDTYMGQPVNFLQTFNSLGGLNIWGAPISAPQADPNNGGFIYQRFQRGIMHFTVGSGTQSILLADYLKAILTTQNLPSDLEQQARETRFYNQYCPSNPLWLCRPNDLQGTDLTYAFVTG
jgi:hypothetical protein